MPSFARSTLGCSETSAAVYHLTLRSNPESLRLCDLQLFTIPKQSWTLFTLQVPCMAISSLGFPRGTNSASNKIEIIFYQSNHHHHHYQQQQRCINNCRSVPSSWLLVFPSFLSSNYVLFSGFNIFIPQHENSESTIILYKSNLR